METEASFHDKNLTKSVRSHDICPGLQAVLSWGALPFPKTPEVSQDRSQWSVMFALSNHTARPPQGEGVRKAAVGRGGLCEQPGSWPYLARPSS